MASAASNMSANRSLSARKELHRVASYRLAQPRPERVPWDEYAEWHLGLTEGASDETKARHAFVYGDFRRVHRSGLIACVYRASEWRHKQVELAAHDLLQELDRVAGIG